MKRSLAASVLVIALLAGLSAAVFVSARSGMADVIARQPRYQAERWRTGKLAPDEHKLSAIQAELHRARNLDSRDPNLLEDLGRFHAARVELGMPDAPDVREARQQSLAYFRQATKLRPTSGHTWINIALLKFRLGEIDQEFTRALELTLRRSPWEPQLQLIAIEVGLAGWPALPDSTRSMLRQAIRDQGQWQLVDQKPRLLSLLTRYRRSDLGCLLAPASACDAS